MKDQIIVIIFSLYFTITLAQQKDNYDYEIQIGHDNDFLVVYTGTDRYYTYGLNAALRWSKENKSPYFFKDKNAHYYNEININIEAYTPHYLANGNIDPDEERPYAGWSYLNFKQATAFKNSFLHIGMDIGILGPDSKAGSIQNWFHRRTGNPELKGWETNQLPNQFGFNLRAKYGVNIATYPLLNIYSTFDTSLGNIYIYGKPMVHIRLGKFLPIQYSVAHDNQLMAPKKETEYYIDTGIGAKLSAYNATVQGNIFSNENEFSSRDINNLIFNAYFGFSFLKNKTSFQLKYHVTTGELISSEINTYATLSIAQRF